VSDLIYIKNLTKSYRRKHVLSIDEYIISRGTINGIIGPDGAGKSTLLKALAGIISYNGSIKYRDIEVRSHPDKIKSLLSYMPQGIGYNLYTDLTVIENIFFFAQLKKIPKKQTTERAEILLQATGLWDHRNKLVSQLSGGMKQKLGLACSLISKPELLILDEPSTGIDPLSRRQLWQVLTERVKTQFTTVVYATSYMDEAERADKLLFLHNGSPLFKGNTLDILKEKESLEEAFFETLKQRITTKRFLELPPGPKRLSNSSGIEIYDLRKTYGKTIALRGITLTIKAGELFGLLGPNGAGKTTLLKCLLGLEKADSGRISVATLSPGSEELKYRVGYMSQVFSLYGDLTVKENILFYGQLYSVEHNLLMKRLQWIVNFSDIKDYLDTPVKYVPLGMKQRLALGVATIHMPDVLFLDEPTSGVDPLTRELFWSFIKTLSEQLGITVVVTTHNLIEADYCHRVAIMNEGEIVSVGSPAELKTEFQKKYGQEYEVKLNKPPSIERLSLKGLKAVPFGRRYHIWGKNITAETLRQILESTGLKVEYLKPIQPPMEDIFIEAIKG